MGDLKSISKGRCRIGNSRQARLLFRGLGDVMLVVLSTALPGRAQLQPADWQGSIRELVSSKRTEQALRLSEQWLAAAPNDLEARGWHARLLAWLNRWGESEAEYRRVLESAPTDVDILLGLADVLTWQKRPLDALEILERACALDPRRADSQVRRGRLLQSIGRTRDARSAFRQALDSDASSADAKAGLDSLREEGRHEIRIGTDVDLFNFTENAGAVVAGLRSRLSRRWTTIVSGTQYRRFGEYATRLSSNASYRLGPNHTLTAGSAIARHRGIIPKSEAYFEYGHGFPAASSLGPIRGVEALYRQNWLWYRDARVLVATPGLVLYFPRDWNWYVQVSAARSHFSGSEPRWTPSGMTRLTFPLSRQLSGHVLYAVGTENFGLVDQIGQFSARAWGGGLRLRLASGQEIRGYGVYQSRSQGQAQTSFGVSYAIRF
jgi:tetratricopeptide (TPR) repeat protein